MVQANNANVNVTIMRWGISDNDAGPMDQNPMDRIVGQIASDKFREVKLVLESAPFENEITKLTISTPVQSYKSENNKTTHCPQCIFGDSRDSGKNMHSTGAKTSGGCYFEFEFPRQQNLKKLRLVDVICDGQSVNYIVKFNISTDLVRTSFKVPVPKTIKVHKAQYTVETVPVPPEE